MSDIVNSAEADLREAGLRFAFHKATEVTGPQHEVVRAQHRMLAEWITVNVPRSRERSLALTALQESMHWCNAAIAYRDQTE